MVSKKSKKMIFCHSCPDFHRDKLQQESSLFIYLEFSGIPFSRLRAEALRRASTGMTTFYDFTIHYFLFFILWRRKMATRIPPPRISERIPGLISVKAAIQRRSLETQFNLLIIWP